MAQYSFGVGFVIGKRIDVSLTAPAFFGVCQEWSLDIDQKVETLMGQYKDPVDAAPAARAITGKVKFGKLSATSIGNSILGVNPTSASGFDIVTAETKTTSATTYTVAAGATYIEDLGVFYAATAIQLQPVASAPATGQYVPGASGTGTYTLASGDAAANLLQFFYSKTATDQYNMTVTQSLMGSGPVMQLDFTNPYTVLGVVKKINILLPATRITKAPFDFKNANYMIPELDFTAFLNASGTIMQWSMTE